MDENQESMENTFSEHLEHLKSGKFSSEETLEISIGDEFQEFLLTNVMRSLGRVFPKVTRAFLRDPDVSDLLYLGTYDYQDDEIRVTVGDNFLR